MVQIETYLKSLDHQDPVLVRFYRVKLTVFPHRVSIQANNYRHFSQILPLFIKKIKIKRVFFVLFSFKGLNKYPALIINGQVIPFSLLMLPVQADSCCLQPAALNKIKNKNKDSGTITWPQNPAFILLTLF